MEARDLNISVCDYDRECLQYIGRLLHQISAIGTSTITYYTSGDWLKSDIIAHESTPDILIINKNLADADGIVLAKLVLSYAPWCRVIILCDENRICPICFSVEHSFILPKELIPMHLVTAVEKAVNDWKSQDTGQIVVTSNRTHMVLPIQKILFMERLQRKTIIVLDTEKIETYQAPNELLSDLPDPAIIQCHKSFFVNTKRVRCYSKNSFTMDDGSEVPIGRAFISNIANAYSVYLKEPGHDESTI